MGFALLNCRFTSSFVGFNGVWLLALVGAATRGAAIATVQTGRFVQKALEPLLPESPFELRFFSGAVKTDSGGDIITGPKDDPVTNIVGAESAGDRLERFTKILFGVDYTGRPDPGTHLDPHNGQVNSGSQHRPSSTTVPQLAKCARTHARRQHAVRHAAGTGKPSALGVV